MLAGLLTLAALSSAPCVRATPLEVYGRLPRYENVVLSPDGSRVAFVRTEGDERVVAVMELAKGDMLARLRAGDQKLRGIAWADDNRLMIMTSVTTVVPGFLSNEGEWRQLQIHDLKSGKSYLVPEPNRFSDVSLMNMIAGNPVARRAKDHTVLFVPGLQILGIPEFRGTGRRVVTALIRVDLESESSRVVSSAPIGYFKRWVIDAAGEVAAEESYDEKAHHWSILVRRDGRMQEAASGDESIDYPRVLGLGPAADTLLLERIEDGDAVWRPMSLHDGSIGPPMADKATFDRPIEERLTHRLIGGVRVADTEEYVFFDPAVQESWHAVLRAFHDERVRFESASADFRKVIVRVEGSRDGYCFELVDLNTQRAEPLGDVYDGIRQPFEVRRITYAAADGLPIQAYLTLPHDKPPKMLPLIVLPHGGPAARDSADFDWWSQALAGQGYAVLRPNYRGSNLSWSFTSKGFGEWGRKMQTDLSDGVRYLAKEGIVDPARVCIAGTSYGGYAALAGPSLDPGIYRCAIAIAGIADVKRMLAWVNQQHYGRPNVMQRYWNRFMGVTGPNDPAVEAISPISHVGAITVPVLLIHGKDDTVVPFEQSQVMYDALKRARKDVQLVTLKHEDHWLSRSETRLQTLESSVAFLRAHNPPD